VAKALEPWSVWGGTNLIYLRDVDAPALVAAARQEGVLIGAIGPRTARLITHLDVDDAAVDRAIEVLLRLLDAR
jgi:threonine aldolase